MGIKLMPQPSFILNNLLVVLRGLKVLIKVKFSHHMNMAPDFDQSGSRLQMGLKKGVIKERGLTTRTQETSFFKITNDRSLEMFQVCKDFH